MWRSNVRGKRPACTEKRKARFVQRDRPEAGVEPARKNYGYFFPEIGLSVRLKILSIWIAAPRCTRRLRNRIVKSSGPPDALQARRRNAVRRRPKCGRKGAVGGEKFGRHQRTFGSLVTP